jgi:hypothetical protein
MTDLKIQTPLGMGTFMLARFQAGRDKNFRYIVRLPVNEVTKPHLKDANCLDKTAKVSSLFFFTAKELGLEETK